MSSANEAAVRYVAESVIGTTPNNPALKALRFTRESLNFNITTTESKEIRADRSLADLIKTAAEVAGDIEFELSYDTFNDFIAGALAGNWSAGPDTFNIVNGVVKHPFTIQKHFTDISQYFNYRGCLINTMALNLAIGQPISGRFGVLGMSSERAGSQISGATIVPVNTNPIFNAVSNIGSILIDSVPYTGCINSISVETNNNLRGQSCIGTLGFKDIVLGSFDLSGSAEIYFADGTMYDKLLNSTPFGFKLSLEDSLGNVIDLEIPKAMVQTAEVVAGGKDTDVMIAITYRGIYDTGISGVVKVTRNDL